ncbi:hypothetical protein PTKIN_Ptkin14bG0216900 [Pterospermum kingtungense]
MKKQRNKEGLIFATASDDQNPSSSGTKPCLCGICMEQKPISRMFEETQCNHSFCFGCTRKHMATKLKDENSIKVRCPESNCERLIKPSQCRSILPREVICRWEKALYYSETPPIMVLQCPYEDCLVKFVDNGKDVGVMKYDCPRCRRKICAECRDMEHQGMDCDEFKLMIKSALKEEEDIGFAVLMLAEKEDWRMCPNCNEFAAKKEGSNMVDCW